jgi:hypothetical protein
LRSLTPAQIAAERGVHRGTVYREVALLRRALEDFLDELDIPRDSSTCGTERSSGRGREGHPDNGARVVPDPPATTFGRLPIRADRGRR